LKKSLNENEVAIDSIFPDARLDDLWARESEDRLDAFDRGELVAVPAEEVFESIKQRRAK
jgi:hypothetical protein